MRLSPGIRNVEPYPFEELDRRKREAVDAGRELVDFGVGDPRDDTPAFIRRALKDAIVPASSYPARNAGACPANSPRAGSVQTACSPA